MPLKQGKSQKAFNKNVEIEMNHGKPQKQALAIAYSVKRKNGHKKMAEGGPVSAKTEKRPNPDIKGEETSRNSGDKPAKMDSASSRPDIKQSQKGPKTTKLKHPSMQQSPVFKVKMRDEEDHLESSDPPASPTEQPPKADDEIDAGNNGEDMHMEDDREEMYASGGEVEMDHHDSVSAAIMARRDRMHAEIDSGAHDLDEAVKMAEGGQVDIDDNNMEEPNGFYEQNEDAALKENLDSDMEDVSQPKDSNEKGRHITSDVHDMVDKIRKIVAAKRK